ncbi:hypothetical protein BHE74_00021189 [Ensete ventricosum]|nr:hypothetical protein BHE74_00021189 [Ensete ventricosum]
MGNVGRRVKFRLVFRAPSQNLKILAIPNVLAHGRSFEHDFVKKRNGHKLCIKSRRVVVKFRSIFRAPSRNFKILAISNVLAHGKSVKFRSIFHAPSRNFKILAIPNVLAHWKSYQHVFMKKCDSYKLCAKSCAESSFDQFFMHRLGI